MVHSVRHSIARAVALLAATVLTAASLAACSPHPQATGEGYLLLSPGALVVGASFDEPLFEFYSGSDPDGYGIAVVREAASRMGLECVIKDVDGSSHEDAVSTIYERLEEGLTYDVCVASLSLDGLAEQNVHATRPYYDADQAVVVRTADLTETILDEKKAAAAADGPAAENLEGGVAPAEASEAGSKGNGDSAGAIASSGEEPEAASRGAESDHAASGSASPKELTAAEKMVVEEQREAADGRAKASDGLDRIEQLSGKPIAVIAGSESEAWAKLNVSDKIQIASSVQQCATALSEKRVDAIALDAHAAQQLVDASDGRFTLLERSITTVRYALAVNPHDDGLADALDKVLDEMDADGTLTRLQDEYLR